MNYYTQKQVSDMLLVDPSTIKRWINAGHLPSVKVGDVRRIPMSVDLDKFAIHNIYYDRAELCLLLDESAKTVDRMIKDGSIPSVKTRYGKKVLRTTRLPIRQSWETFSMWSAARILGLSTSASLKKAIKNGYIDAYKRSGKWQLRKDQIVFYKKMRERSRGTLWSWKDLKEGWDMYENS